MRAKNLMMCGGEYTTVVHCPCRQRGVVFPWRRAYNLALFLVGIIYAIPS